MAACCVVSVATVSTRGTVHQWLVLHQMLRNHAPALTQAVLTVIVQISSPLALSCAQPS